MSATGASRSILPEPQRDQRDGQVVSLYVRGLSMEDLAHRFGMSAVNVWKIVQRAGAHRGHRGQRGAAYAQLLVDETAEPFDVIAYRARVPIEAVIAYADGEPWPENGG